MARPSMRPGEKAPVSGEFKTPGGPRITIDKGEKAPPTPGPGKDWTLVPGTQTNPGPGAKRR